MLAKQPLNAGHGRGVGAKDSAGECAQQVFGQKMGDVAGHRLLSVAHLDAQHSGKGRIMVLRTVAKQDVHHARYVVVGHLLQHRMPGRGRLHEKQTALLASAGAPCNLQQQLKGAFVGPKVGAAQHRIGVGHDGERQAGDVEPLAHHLGSDDEVDFARLHPLQKVAHSPLASGRIGIHAKDARLRKKCFDFFFDALGSESAPVPGRLAALRAGLGQVLVEPAVVANELPRFFVVGQRDVALRTGLNPPAVHAGQHRSIPSAVLKDQHLLAVNQGLGYGGVGFGRERPHFLVQRLGFEGAQRAHFWKSHARIPLGECGPGVLAGDGMVPGFGRGRRRSQHNRNFFLLGQPHGHVAGVVARSRFLLLVAGFVFFVDHN